VGVVTGTGSEAESDRMIRCSDDEICVLGVDPD
jgi:hypothetical protein